MKDKKKKPSDVGQYQRAEMNNHRCCFNNTVIDWAITPSVSGTTSFKVSKHNVNKVSPLWVPFFLYAQKPTVAP